MFSCAASIVLPYVRQYTQYNKFKQFFFQKVDSFYAIAQPLQIKNLSVYSNVRKET